MPPEPALAAEVVAGSPRAVARAISLVEDERPAGVELLRAVHAHTGRAYIVGITGPPGAGKSTLVDRLAVVAREAGQRVGVLAVDPTSPFSGGAVLGDRVRMGRHAADEAVFIRSMATRGHLGGVARATAAAAAVLDAAGYDIVVIETVGVGQDEVEIARTADVTVVVLVPGTGDEVQALKAGIMEIADMFVVNKADREGADRLVQAIASNLDLQRPAAGDWHPPIVETVATTGTGIAEVWAAIQRFRSEPSRHAARRRVRHEQRLRDLVGLELQRHVDRAVPSSEVEQALDRIESGAIDPHSAAVEIARRALRTAPADEDGDRSP